MSSHVHNMTYITLPTVLAYGTSLILSFFLICFRPLIKIQCQTIFNWSVNGLGIVYSKTFQNSFDICLLPQTWELHRIVPNYCHVQDILGFTHVFISKMDDNHYLVALIISILFVAKRHVINIQGNEHDSLCCSLNIHAMIF